MDEFNYEKESSFKIKSDFKSLIYKLIKNIINNITLGIAFIVFFKKWIFVAAFIIFDILFIILDWINEYLDIKDNEIIYHKGIIFKDSLIIPKKSFKSMDISQSFIEKLLRYSVVKIESPSKDLDIEDIKMSLNETQINILKSFSRFDEADDCILSEIDNNENDINNRKERTVGIKNLLLYGITSFNLFITLIFIFKFSDKLKDIIKYDYFGNVLEGSLNKFSLLLLFTGLIFFLIFLKCIATIYYIIKYYNFTLINDGENLNISYGLLNTKEFTFKSSSIKLIKLKSNPLRQLLGVYELNLIIKGYTGDDNEKILMYPIGSLDEINSIIDEFIPNWSFTKDVEGIKYGKFNICMKPILLILLISIIFYFIFNKSWILFINLLSLVTLINSLLRIKNISIGFDNNKVKVTNGGLFKTIYILNIKDIQAVEFKTNPIQERKNIGKIVINYYSENSEEIKLSYMDKNYVKKLLTTVYTK